MPTALKLVENPFVMRKFDTADLSEHGAWLLPRLMQAYPHLNERAAATFLQNIIYHNEYCFLYQPTGVALVQIMSAHTLDPKAVVYERFVWVKDREDKQQLKDAAEFYVEFHRWAKLQATDVMIVEENSDVPHDAIKEKLGRIFTRQQQFAKL